MNVIDAATQEHWLPIVAQVLDIVRLVLPLVAAVAVRRDSTRRRSSRARPGR